MGNRNKITDVFDEWEKNPDRKIWFVDEVRPPYVKGDQYVIFSMVCFSAQDVINAYRAYISIEEKLPKQTAKAVIKGKHLFGKKQKRSHSLLRDFVWVMLSHFRAAYTMTTTNKCIEELNSELNGKIKTKDDRGNISEIGSPELKPFLLFLKQVSRDHNLKNEQVDVIIDNSEQIGFANLDDDRIETLGPDNFSQTFQGKSEFESQTRFRLFFSTESSEAFKSLLLLPDSVCYMGEKTDYFLSLKDQVSKEKFWLKYLDVLDLIFEYEVTTLEKKHEISNKEKRKAVVKLLEVLKKLSIVSEFEIKKITKKLLNNDAQFLKPKFKPGDFISISKKKGAKYALCGVVHKCINVKDRNGYFKYHVRLIDPLTRKIAVNPHRTAIVEARLSKSVAAKILYSR